MAENEKSDCTLVFPTQQITKPERFNHNPVANPGMGMYIRAKLGTETFNLQVKMLVDSGATMSLLNEKILSELPIEARPVLEKSNSQIKFANGEVQRVLGRVKVPVQINGFTKSVDFLIGSFTDEAILGINDLQLLGLEIDFKNMILHKGDTLIPTEDSCSVPLSCKVYTKHTVALPPGKISTIWANVKREGVSDHVNSPMMLQSVRSIVHKHGIIPAKSLHNASDNQVPVSLFNPNEDTVVIDPNETLGILVPVLEVDSQVSEIIDTEHVRKCTAETKPSDDQEIGLPEHLVDLYERSTQHLNASESKELKQFLIRYESQFSRNDFDIGYCDIIEHEINTKEPPTKQNPRKLGPEQRIAADKIVDELLDRGLIKPSKSPWASPIVMVKKKDNTYRMCIDYRELNKSCPLDAYPLPTVNQCLSQLSQARWFCSTDLASGYWQVKMSENSKEKTAFCTRKGLFEWEVMPFGLSSACATFQRLMETILCEMRFEELLIYLDDILIWGRSVKETLERLGKFLDRLKIANLKLKPNKCFLFQKSVQFLGHVVSDKGVSCDPQKVEAIKSWKVPSNVKELRSFLGLCNYYKKFISDYSTLMKPLSELTSPKVKFKWDEKCQNSFENLKQLLVSAPILGYPKDSGTFVLDTDASDVGLGAVLSQIQDDREVVISYGSRTLTPQEINYCVTRKELLAIVHHIKTFKDYLLGKHFKVRTDHWSLKYLKRFKEPEGQLARWIDFLQPFDFEIITRNGNKHGNADALSRREIPCGGKKCQCKRFLEFEYDTPVSLEVKLQKEIGTQTMNDLYIPTLRGVQVVESVDSGNFDHETCETLGQEQAKDPDIGPIYKFVECGEKPKWPEISHLSSESKRLIGDWHRLSIVDNILFRKWESNDGQKCWNQLVLPAKYRNSVLCHLHDSVTGGHLGLFKTLAKTQARFFWPKMRQDIKLWIQTCEACQLRKGPSKLPKASMQTYLVGAPFERIAADIMGPFSTTDNDNTWLLVIGDYFTKYAVSVPLKDMTAKSVAQALIDNWIGTFGSPFEIHTDQGSNFESLLFTETCKLLGIDKTRTTPMRPQSDGFVERLNQTICNILNCVIYENPFSWDKIVKLCTLAYNSSVQESTGQTPYFMVFGREATLPIDLVCPVKQPGIKQYKNSSEFVQELQQKLKKAHHLARAQNHQATIRQERSYNNRIKQNEYHVGSLVYYLNPFKGNAGKEKFYKWNGPFVVITKISDRIYRLQENVSSPPFIANHDRLKPAYCRKEIDISWVQELDYYNKQKVLMPTQAEKDLENDCGLPSTQNVKRPKRAKKAPDWYGNRLPDQ